MTTGPGGPVGSMRPMGAVVKWGVSPWQRAYGAYGGGGGKEGSGVPCHGNGTCRSYGGGGNGERLHGNRAQGLAWGSRPIGPYKAYGCLWGAGAKWELFPWQRVLWGL